MIYILVGPDGSGKTELAKRLVKDTKATYVKKQYAANKDEEINMLNDYCNAMTTALTENIVFDRAWYCEMVYGPVMRGTSVINEGDCEYLESVASSIGAIIIYCTEDPAVLWDRCQKRGEEYIKTFEQLQEIKHRYDDLLLNQSRMIPVVTYRIPAYD